MNFMNCSKEKLEEYGFVGAVEDMAEYTGEKKLCILKLGDKGFEPGYDITMKMSGNNGVIIVNNVPRMGWNNVVHATGFGVYMIDRRLVACVVVTTETCEDYHTFLCSLNYDEKHSGDDKILFVEDEDVINAVESRYNSRRAIALEVEGHCRMFDAKTLEMVYDNTDMVFDEGLGDFVSM